jgi:chromosome segregation ATPase
MTDVSSLPPRLPGSLGAAGDSDGERSDGELSLAEQELFLAQQRLQEARMALIEASAQKDELRDTAAALAVEARDLRVRIGIAEAAARRAETERALLAERVAQRVEGVDELVQRLSLANRDLVAAHESNNERDLQIDQLQLQIMELRRALAKARGFEGS